MRLQNLLEETWVVALVISTLTFVGGGGICPLHNMFGGGGGGVGGRGDANVLTCQFSWGRWGEGANVRGADVLHPIGWCRVWTCNLMTKFYCWLYIVHGYVMNNHDCSHAAHIQRMIFPHVCSCQRHVCTLSPLSRLMTKPTKWHVRQAKTQISLAWATFIFNKCTNTLTCIFQ